MLRHPELPRPWRDALEPRLPRAALERVLSFVAEERRVGTVFPPTEQVFAALALTPPAAVRVVILGQDPYHDEGQAHGLAFSVPAGVVPPPSLRNVLRELREDLGTELAGHGCLRAWAERGVLLLNTVLTVRAHEPGSHANHGWERVTRAVLQTISVAPEPVVFLLWGRSAQRAAGHLATHHTVFVSPHPSPLSAHRGFFGSRPFSKANEALRRAGRHPIDWSLPPLPSS